MPIDFTLTPPQSDLRKQTRDFANEVLAGVDVLTDSLPTAAERFAATRPIYQEMIRKGFLRRCIPTQFGGDGSGGFSTWR
jgi:nitroalkane oxidase